MVDYKRHRRTAMFKGKGANLFRADSGHKVAVYLQSSKKSKFFRIRNPRLNPFMPFRGQIPQNKCRFSSTFLRFLRRQDYGGRESYGGQEVTPPRKNFPVEKNLAPAHFAPPDYAKQDAGVSLCSEVCPPSTSLRQVAAGAARLRTLRRVATTLASSISF